LFLHRYVSRLNISRIFNFNDNLAQPSLTHYDILGQLQRGFLSNASHETAIDTVAM